MVWTLFCSFLFFFFLLTNCLWFWYEGMTSFINWNRKCSLSSIFWKRLCKMALILKLLEDFSSESIWVCIFYFRSFLITNLISSIFVGLLNCSVSYWMSELCTFVLFEELMNHLNCQIHVHIIVLFPYYLFDIWSVCSVSPHFNPDNGNMLSSLFFFCQSC